MVAAVGLNRNSGFSLVEILVAMTLLLTVLSLGSIAYGQFRTYWTQQLGDFDQLFEDSKGGSQLLHAIKNIQPFIIKDDEDNAFHYFEGADTLIRSVISHSLQDASVIAAFEIYVKVDRQNQNQLFYREQVFQGSPLLLESDINNYGAPILLLSGFTNFQFEFYSYTHADDWYAARENPQAVLPNWYGSYSGKDTLILPKSVKISFVKDEQVSQLIVPLRHFSPEQLEFYDNESD